MMEYTEMGSNFDNGLIDERGRIKIHLENSGYDTDPKGF